MWFLKLTRNKKKKKKWKMGSKLFERYKLIAWNSQRSTQIEFHFTNDHRQTK